MRDGVRVSTLDLAAHDRFTLIAGGDVPATAGPSLRVLVGAGLHRSLRAVDGARRDRRRRRAPRPPPIAGPSTRTALSHARDRYDFFRKIHRPFLKQT